MKKEVEQIVLYDGVCNLCNASVNFIIEHDPEARFQFAPMQEPAGQALLKKHGLEDLDMSSFVLIKDSSVFLRSTAWMHIVRDLRGPWKALSVFGVVPSFIRDGIYNFIGTNRYKWFGKKDMCLIPTPDIRKRFIGWEKPSGV